MGLEGIFEPVDRIGGEPITARMAQKAPIRHVDATLLFVTIGLAAFGAVMVFSSTVSKQEQTDLDPAFYLKRQVMFTVVGVLLLTAVIAFDYRHLRALAPVLYGATIFTLLLVLTPAGREVSGATRWIDFGFFQIQPSELAKTTVIVCLATSLANRSGQVRARDVTACIILVMVPILLIYLQPDLGTTIVFAGVTGVVLLVGGAKIRHFLALAVLGLVGVIVVLQAGLLRDYQIARITAFLDPNPDVRSEGYNLIQSKIAIGSGGLHGKGLRDGDTQTALDFVPEQHTDFIFTAVGEQLGFVGAAGLLALFALLIWRALRIAAMAQDLFGTLLAAGVAGLWSIQVFVNVGMTMGIMPITGIPLPFLSYGGSSLLTNFAAVGLLMNVHMRRFLSPKMGAR